MAASARRGYQGNMNIAYPAGGTLSDWLMAIIQAWLARSLGQWVLVPVSVGRRRIATAPRLDRAGVMGDAL